MNNQNNLEKNSIQNFSENYTLTLQDYLLIFKIHLKKIIICLIIGFMSSIYYTYTITPTFQSTSKIEVREKPGANMIMDISGRAKIDKMTNEIQIIKSRVLAKRVVKRLWESNRRNNLHLFGTRIHYPKGQSVRQLVKEFFSLGLYDENSLKPKEYNEPYSENIGEKFSGKVLSGLKVNNIKNTNILKITFSSPNADEARRIANLVANTYIDFDRERSRENARRSVAFLDSLVYSKRGEIEIIEKEIREFKLNNNMYGLDGDASSISLQLNNYESDLYTIQAEINIRKEKVEILNSRLTKEEKSLTGQIINDINSQLINLRLEIGRLESQLLQNKNKYGSSHDAVIGLTNKIDRLKGELDTKVSILISKGITVQDPLQTRQEIISQLLNLDSEIISYQLRESEIKKMLNHFTQKLNDLPEKQMDLTKLVRDADILKQNYLFLKQKLEDAELNVAIEVGDVFLLDKARRPSSPIGPNHNRNIILGIFLGLSFGVLLVFMIEFLDNSLKTVDEIEKYALTVLGIIPAIGNTQQNSKKDFLFWKNKLLTNQNTNTLKRRLITKEDPKSPVSEAYRSLRTSMLYSSTNKVKSVLVSSAGPGEGKTTTVANLAITYANLGKKTLLVDTDLRRPVVHKVFNLEREPGVTNFLSGQAKNIENLVQETDIDNLSIITSGIIPPNPSEMLGSEKMISFVKTLEEGWDMVLFDSPPLVAVTDANMISREIDRIVLVVKVGQTDKKAFHHTINNLKNIDAPLGGIIMNAVTNKSSYGSYYYYYYHQYYQYYGSEKDSD